MSEDVRPEDVEPLPEGFWKSWQGPGELPPGLTYNAETGILSGTPTQSGVFEFEVSLPDPDPPRT